jgi:hypothetical protein
MTDDDDGKDEKASPDKAGKISHDARGNAVWQWGSGAIRQTLDSTSKMLRRLEVPGLELLDDPKPGDKPAVDPMEALKTRRAAGFDPYEGRQKATAATQQKQPPRPAAPLPPARPPTAARPAGARPSVPARPGEEPADMSSLLGRLFGKDRDR